MTSRTEHYVLVRCGLMSMVGNGNVCITGVFVPSTLIKIVRQELGLINVINKAFLHLYDNENFVQK